MPGTSHSQQTIKNPVLANQIMGIIGGPQLAVEGLAHVLSTSYIRLRSAEISFVHVDRCSGLVIFQAKRGLPPAQLIQVAKALSEWFENRMDEILPERRKRQLQRAI